jgi:two-component system response regulator GlrR
MTAKTPDRAPPDAATRQSTEGMQRDVEEVQGFSLSVLAGADAGARFVSAGPATTLGTHERATLVLKDPTVSRFHCEIAISEGRARVRDLGSLNGTLIDGVPVYDAPLRSGATLTLGRTKLRFDVVADTVRIPIGERDRFGTMIGRSPAMRRAFSLLERAASSDATVLLLGETGTGKEAAAESLHQASARADEPFMVLDCAALPHDLLESELFGHERGAFTGAVRDRAGIFEAADGGTVFLDEVGEIDLDLQPKLLRVLERREVRRLGSSVWKPVNVRILAATNRDLRTEVNAQRFRPDLYYRLAVVEVRLPSLRERLDDLPLLVEHFLDALGAGRAAGAALVRSPSFLARLRSHGWPGNVRELRNHVERALTLHDVEPMESTTQVLGGAGAPHLDIDVDQPIASARDAWVRHFERAYLERLLEKHGGNVTAAARAAGLHRAHIYRLLWKHHLK